MPMRAGLPMYDADCLRPFVDAWWQGLDRAVRRAGLSGLPAMTRTGDPHALWQAPDLLLSQICGYVLNNRYRDSLQPLLTPCYAAPGCDGPRYRSVLLAREDNPARCLADLRGTICACNEADSHSGINALARTVAPLTRENRFFSGHRFTGSHAASMAAVRAGSADVCAVDCVTYALLSRHDPETTAGLRQIGYSASAPGLPYVTAAATPPDSLQRLREAIAEAMADPDLAGVRDALLLSDARPLSLSDYAEISIWPRDGLGPTLS